MAFRISHLADFVETTVSGFVLVDTVRIANTVNPVIDFVFQSIDVNPSVDLVDSTFLVSPLKSFMLFSILSPDSC